MRYFLPAFVFAVLVAASGVIHGIRTERWKPTSGVEESARRLDNVPIEFGEWKGERLSMDANDLARAGIKNHFYCKYTNTRLRQTITVLAVCGRSGPISVHTPDVCYEAAGYQTSGPPDFTEVALNDSSATKFADITATKQNSRTTSRLAILWAWNGGNGWGAVENPRLTYARHPFLYKLYVIREKLSFEHGDPSADFLRVFLPELDHALFAKMDS